MISLKCSQCNAELLPDAKFCRRCGSVVTADVAAAAISSSELPTLTLDEQATPTTRSLTPRVTSPETPRQTVITAADLTKFPAPQKQRRFVLIGSLIVVVLLGIVGSVAYVGIRSDSRTADDAALIYPGSKTIVDFSSGDGRAFNYKLRTR
ncbi:MAG TPA: zinc ribbon domain-containing protein [Pyrinomonadaceae bacterium]|nr:zinc ribbon domain-containing protein [Pyrinomonadaceae bacterium]